MSSGVDLAGLREIDLQAKPTAADDEWIRAHQYYLDTGRSETIQRLDKLGVGLMDNRRPLEISILRRIIDRLAVVYDQPPTRWLVNPATGERAPEESTAHAAMTRVLERAQYDLAWRLADRLRALMRQVGIRFYASDPQGTVVLRLFEPYNMIRDFDPAAPDQIEQDRRFALRLRGKDDADDQLWEYWERSGDGWVMAHVNKAGELEEHQPFDMRPDKSSPPSLEDLISPYPELPAQIVYDEYPGGRGWLPPRGSRTSFVEAINAIANDLWALITHQAHTDRFFKTDDTSRVPSKKGPGMAAAIPADTDVVDLQPNPKIKECTDVLQTFIKLWSVSEDLPVDEFLNRQVVTGAALKAAERALMARREAQVLLAPNDERLAYRKLRAVHNTHTTASNSHPSWDLPPLEESWALDVEIGDVNGPTDMRELQESMARSIALGSQSVIDLIQAEQGVARHRAVRIFERVRQDREDYPPSENPGALQTGPRMADVDATPEAIEEPQRGTSASVVQNIKAS